MDKEKNSVIYAIRCKENGRVYIGCTANFEARAKSHLSQLRNGEKRREQGTSRFQDDYDQFGEDSFEFYILEENIPWAQRKAREVYWIEVYDAMNEEFGYNARHNSNKRAKGPNVVAGMPPVKRRGVATPKGEPAEMPLQTAVRRLPLGSRGKMGLLQTWTGEIHGLLHIYRLTVSDLAKEANRNQKYVSTVLNDENTVNQLKDVLFEAVDRLIDKKIVAGELAPDEDFIKRYSVVQKCTTQTD